MPRITLPFSIELDNGETIHVVGDQRDIAALEATDYLNTRHIRGRFLAWSAARRAGRYTGSWEAFNTKDAVEVIAEDPDGDTEDGDGLDPGRKGQSATD